MTIEPQEMRNSSKSTATVPAQDLSSESLSQFVPTELLKFNDIQSGIPFIAKNPKLTHLIDEAITRIPTEHKLICRDSRKMEFLAAESVHLIVTSPPYWTLKLYRDTEGQLGHVSSYDNFLSELDRVWRECFRVLVPGGRLVCVVGDVCLSRRENNGRHTVIPLHASIQNRCRKIGFDNLAPIIWHKISNAAYEVDNGAGFLGKPYEPNGVIKNDIEFILMERKPGGYRAPSLPKRLLSIISAQNHKKWFQQIWTGLNGASTRDHPAPFPEELAERLIRMFSFVGDTILDPFLGTGTTSVVASRTGRNSIGIEIDEHYFKLASDRISRAAGNLFDTVKITEHALPHAIGPKN